MAKAWAGAIVTGRWVSWRRHSLFTFERDVISAASGVESPPLVIKTSVLLSIVLLLASSVHTLHASSWTKVMG